MDRRSPRLAAGRGIGVLQTSPRAPPLNASSRTTNVISRGPPGAARRARRPTGNVGIYSHPKVTYDGAP